MRIAALYDIHGNAPALRAVVEEAVAAGATLAVVGGDVVAGPQPAEVLDLLVEGFMITRWVMGNADREVLDPAGTEGLTRTVAEWAGERLRAQQRDLLSTFEPVVRVSGALFCHATPRSDEEIWTRASADERFAAPLAGVLQRTVLCGHVHQRFDRVVDGHRVVNPGSVGMPYEGDAAAFWALLDGGEVELRRTAYDVPAALEEMRATGMPAFDDYLGDSLIEPCDPDAVTRFFEAQPSNG